FLEQRAPGNDERCHAEQLRHPEEAEEVRGIAQRLEGPEKRWWGNEIERSGERHHQEQGGGGQGSGQVHSPARGCGSIGGHRPALASGRDSGPGRDVPLQPLEIQGRTNELLETGRGRRAWNGPTLGSKPYGLGFPTKVPMRHPLRVVVVLSFLGTAVVLA